MITITMPDWVVYLALSGFWTYLILMAIKHYIMHKFTKLTEQIMAGEGPAP